MKIGIFMAVAVVSAPCLPAKVYKGPYETTVTMSKQRVLFVHHFQRGIQAPLDVKHNYDDPFYQLIIKWVGGIKEGETKIIPQTGDLATMLKGSTISVHRDAVPDQSFDEIIRPGEMNYDQIIRNVGGLLPEQRKTIPGFIGFIVMNNDGAFEYHSYSSVELTFPVRKIRPGDNEFRSLSSLVGPLKPGETAMIKADAVESCSNFRD